MEVPDVEAQREEIVGWTTVRFLDPDGSPIPHVSLEVTPLVSPDARFLHDSNAAGEARFSLAGNLAGGGLALLATQDGYLPFESEVRPPIPELLTIVLQPLAHLTGTVVDVDGRPIVTRPTVIAFVEGRAPTKRELHDALAGRCDRVLAGKADESGAFALPGAELGSAYELLSGGKGFASKATSVAMGGASNITLQLEALYGARVTVEGLEEKPFLWEGKEPTWFWDPAITGLAGFETDNLAAILLGLEVQETFRITTNPLHLLFTGPPGSNPMGPIRFRGQPAGRTLIDVEIWMPRIEESIQEIALASSPLARGWGKVSVRFAGLPGSNDRSPERAGRLGVITFDSADDQTTIERAFSSWEAKALEIEGIPFGRYSVAISTEAGYSHYPCVERSVEVTSADEAKAVTFDLSLARRVELAAVRRGGELAAGEILVGIAQNIGEDWYSTFARFHGPPYLVDGLIPGSYRFTIYRPFYDPQSLDIEVSSLGESQSLVFQELY